MPELLLLKIFSRAIHLVAFNPLITTERESQQVSNWKQVITVDQLHPIRQ